jgi:DNA invertase Pin-like site-specific DNA recombinase
MPNTPRTAVCRQAARKETLKAAIYCRVASADELAIKAQEEALRKYAAKQMLEVGGVYSDNGVSGLTLDRPRLGALLANVRSGKVKRLIVADLSRLARNRLLVCELTGMFSEHGVELTAVSDGDAMGTESRLFGLIGGLAQKRVG